MSENSAPPSDPIEPAASSDAAADSNASIPEVVEPSTSEVAVKEVAPSPSAAQAAAADPVHVEQTEANAKMHERAYAQYQSLAQIVLESAEVASRSAEAALNSGQDLKMATQHFRELTNDGHKKARLLLAISAGFMLVCLIFFLIMGVRMVSRVHQLDVALDATTQRVAEMLVGLETLEKLSTGIADLSKRQEDLTKIQTSIEDRIDTALKQTEAMTQKVPVETAKQVASKSDTMIKQVQSVGSGLQAQSRAVQDLSREVQSLKSGLGQVDALKKDVEALVSLQRERYLEVLQKNQGATRGASDRIVQYPRPAPSNEPTTR